jgi:hypothetical protein
LPSVFNAHPGFFDIKYKTMEKKRHLGSKDTLKLFADFFEESSAKHSAKIQERISNSTKLETNLNISTNLQSNLSYALQIQDRIKKIVILY